MKYLCARCSSLRDKGNFLNNFVRKTFFQFDVYSFPLIFFFYAQTQIDRKLSMKKKIKLIDLIIKNKIGKEEYLFFRIHFIIFDMLEFSL